MILHLQSIIVYLQIIVDDDVDDLSDYCLEIS